MMIISKRRSIYHQLMVMLAIFLTSGLAGCSFFGPNNSAPDTLNFTLEWQAPAERLPSKKLTPFMFSGVSGPEWLRQNKVMYSLDFAEANQLRQYAYSRWSSTPVSQLQQILSRNLTQQFNVQAFHSIGLKLELVDFRQHFNAKTDSFARLQIFAVLSNKDRIMARHEFIISCPAKRHDAPGGILALNQCAQQFEAALFQWLEASLP